MILRERDRAIIKDLNKFRVMDRDSIAEIHFSEKKNPQHSANNVLLRLLRDGLIQRSTAFVPYVYFGPETQIKKNSQKIGHFLAIVETYKEIRKHGAIETFLVEPKYGNKGTAEPDIYLKFRNTGFFIEVQKSIYSEKQMTEKMERYVDFHSSGIMSDPFPHLLILGEQRYALDGDYPFKIFQAENFNQFLDSLKPKHQPIVRETNVKEVKIKIG
ncbi:replication-relaxation family protein [Robertmurraya korlensis]|uniref:replication-relaxation family protein n=1 Tax=Robertmurraya korlensis TaxID=519977 RepID=UPI00203ECC1B|nr:replication-relaxation family protein [Robertmurraya korlensis]MCM3599417.1 replication-relaxation family protein [Robertmurraya korlensis]